MGPLRLDESERIAAEDGTGTLAVGARRRHGHVALVLLEAQPEVSGALARTARRRRRRRRRIHRRRTGAGAVAVQLLFQRIGGRQDGPRRRAAAPAGRQSSRRIVQVDDFQFEKARPVHHLQVEGK